MSSQKVRFAPSPTGMLHVGNVRTALVNYLYIRHLGGQFMLRIDDTDEERSTAEFEAGIRDDLRWLGLEWDVEDRQSERLSRYDEALQTLLQSGRAYPCYETQEELSLKRKSQLMAGKPPVYDRAALKLTEAEKQAFEAEGRRPHYRFLLKNEMVSWTDLIRGDVSYHMSSLSDPVLMREDGRVIYTMASVVDDIDHEITTIIRGEDHVTNSAAQIQLFEALGASAPQMGHLALLAGAEGEGLSKRLGSLSINQLREEGMRPEAVVSLLGRIGTSQPVEVFSSLEALAQQFDISAFGRATAKFSTAELSQLNARLLQQLEYSDVQDELAALGMTDLTSEFWLAVRGNIKTISEAQFWWDICHHDMTSDCEDADFIAQAAALMPDGPFTSSSWSEWTKSVAEATGRKGKTLFMPLRQALTGVSYGPDMAQMLVFIGHDRARARLSLSEG